MSKLVWQEPRLRGASYVADSPLGVHIQIILGNEGVWSIHVGREQRTLDVNDVHLAKREAESLYRDVLINELRRLEA